MATNLSEPPGQPPGVKNKNKTADETTAQNASMDNKDKDQSKDSSTEAKDQSTGSNKRKILSNESEDEADKSESLDDICRKKFKPIAPKPFLKKDQHQSVVMTAVPVKEGAAEKMEKGSSCSVDSDSPTKGAVIFMGPNMQLYPSAPFIVQPPPLVPCSGAVGGAFSFAMPAPVGHFMPQVAHLPGFCPSGQYQCCVRLPPPVIEGRDYYVNEVRPGGKTINKDEVETKVPSKTKSHSTVTPSSKESNKSKASKYKYSILYNGPIYKGATSSPQQSATNTPLVESFVPVTESDGAGNVKLSLPAVLSSTGVLQITVPSLRSIDPKQTTNPNVFPQIKLQTVHGAVLTPGVLPTVLSPQHHPNSGHVVVVSAAQNQANRILPSRVSVPSAAVVAQNVVSAVSKTTASISAIVVSSGSRSTSSSTGGSSSTLTFPEVGQTIVTNSTSSSPTVLNSDTRSVTSAAGSHNQSLHSILGQAQNTDTTLPSTTPTTTVPLVISTRNITSPTSGASSVVTVSRTDSQQVPSRMTVSVQEPNMLETNSVRQRTNNTSHTSVTTSPPTVALELQNLVGSRTSQVSATSHSSNGRSEVAATTLPGRNSSDSRYPIADNNVNRHPTADTVVNRLPTAATGVNRLPTAATSVNRLPTADNSMNRHPTANTNVNTPNNTILPAFNSEGNHANSVTNVQVRTQSNLDQFNLQGTPPAINPASDIVRWPNQSVIPSHRPMQLGSTNSRNREDNSRLTVGQNHVNRTQASQMTSPQVITSTPAVSSILTPSASTPKIDTVQVTRTESQQHVTVPRLGSSGRADMLSERPDMFLEQRQPMIIPPGRPNINPSNSDLNLGMGGRNDSGTGSNNSVPGHNSSGSSPSVGDLNQRTLPGLVQQQRHQENRPGITSDISHGLPTPAASARRPPQLIEAGSRSVGGSFQLDHASSSRSISNGKTISTVTNDSTISSVRRGLIADSSRADLSSNVSRRSTAVISHGKQQKHLQQFPQTPINQMPHQNRSSTSQINSDQQLFPPTQTKTSTAPDVTTLNQQPQTYSSSSGIEGQTEDLQGPPVVCVTPRNEFVRPASSTHRWPQIGISSGSQNQSRPTAILTTASATQCSYTPAVQSGTRNYATNPATDNIQIGQLLPGQERSAAAGINRACPTENRTTSSSQSYNSMQGPKNTSRPWQSSNESVVSGNSSAYGGLGQRDRASSSAGHLNDSQTYMPSDLENQTNGRFKTSSSVSDSVDKELGTHVQSVPLFSNVPSNTRQVMNDVINRRASRPSRLQPNQSHSDHLPAGSSSSSSNQSTRLNLEQEDSHLRSRFDSSLMSPERSPASVSHLHSPNDHVGHTGGGILQSAIARFPMPIMHPMLYGNSPSMPNFSGMSSLHGVPPHLAGGFGSHRHGVRTPHPLTPPPVSTHHTSPRPAPHGHNHMFVAPPYASMHRPLYMPATSPRPPDLGLVSPRAYSHVHDSGLYSPRFPSLPSAESILNSHFARTFSDDHLDSCCSGLHAHSPPAPSPNSRPILPPRFSSPAPSIGSHPLPLLPSSTPSNNLLQGSFQGTPHTVMPSDIFGPSHLGIAPPVTSQTTRTSNIVTCASSSPSVPTPLTVQTNLNPHVTNPRSASSSSSNVPSEGTSTVTPTGSSHNSPPTASPLPARVFMGNTSDKYLPLEDAPPTPGSSNGGAGSSSTAALNSDQIVKFGDVILESSRQILRESGRTVLCCWHCDYHSAEPKKMYRHQKKDTKEMKCQLCDFKGFSRCVVNQHFKEKHMDMM